MSAESTDLYDALAEAGFDVRGYLRDKFIKPKMARASKDKNERRVRKRVDELLAQINPVEVSVGGTGAVTEVVQLGASGYRSTVSEEQELAEVDVLDDSAVVGEGDRAADLVKVFDKAGDEFANGDKDTPTEVERSGAQWHLGFRTDAGLNAELKDYQRECQQFVLNLLVHNKGSLVAHAMGLGKSFTTLAVLEACKSKMPALRAVIVCPKGMITPWGMQFKQWDKVISLDAHLTINTPDDALDQSLKLWHKHGGVAVVGHEQFRRMSSAFALDEDAIVVVDEAHLLKTATTALYGVVDSLPTKRRILLTGTPLQNNLKEYFTMIQLVSPGLLGANVADFNKLYGNDIEAGMLKDATDQQVAKSERTVQVLRWRVQDVMHDQSADILRSTIPAKTEFRLLHGSDEVVPDDSVIVERHNVHDAARDEKTLLVKTLVGTIRANAPNDSIVVFSTRRDTITAMQKEVDGLVYVGSSTTDQRDKILRDFPRFAGDVLYVTTKAGGVGINLSQANRVIIADASWNPVDDEQAVSRCFRIGQAKPVFVYRLIAKDTLEERIYRICIKKHIMAARILDEQDVNRVYSKEDLWSLTESFDDQDPLSTEQMSQCDKSLFACFLSMHAKNSPFYVTDHDALFSATNAELSDADRASAVNDMNAILRTHPRVYSAGEDTVTISVGEHLFDDMTFVPPYTPFFVRGTPTPAGVLSATGKMSWSNAVHFSGTELVWIRIGPFVPNPGYTLFFQVFVRDADQGDEDWQRIGPSFEARLMPQKAGRQIDHLDYNLGQLNDGVYVFKVRMVSEDGRISPWSDESAPVRITTPTDDE